MHTFVVYCKRIKAFLWEYDCYDQNTKRGYELENLYIVYENYSHSVTLLLGSLSYRHHILTEVFTESWWSWRQRAVCCWLWFFLSPNFALDKVTGIKHQAVRAEHACIRIASGNTFYLLWLLMQAYSRTCIRRLPLIGTWPTGCYRSGLLIKNALKISQYYTLLCI